MSGELGDQARDPAAGPVWRVAGPAAATVPAPGARAWMAALCSAGFASLAEERARWVNWLPVILGLGIAGYFALPVEPTLAASLLPLGSGLVLWVLAARQPGLRLIGACLVIAGAGFHVAKLRALWVAAPVLERTLRAVAVTGIVERREPHAKRGEKLTLRVTAIAGVDEDRLPRRARVRVMVSGPDLRPGQSVRLVATLSPPAGPALPGGHDFARAAFFVGIGAVGYALKPPERLPVAGDLPLTARLNAGIEDVRQEITARIGASLPGETGGLASALITGERGGITQETTEVYRDSGLVHILSISGLHMAIMAGSVFASARLLLAAIPFLALTYPIKKWAAGAGAIGAVLYFAISGGSAAPMRAAIMMVVLFVAVMLGRPAIALRNVALAALLILVLFPESLFDVGFQMSFAAVTALVAAYEGIRGHFDRAGLRPGIVARGGLFLGGIVFTTVIAGLAVTPLSIYHFHATQHYAALANLVAVPVCNFLVMPAALATLLALPFGLEAWPLAVMGLGLDMMGWVANRVAALPGAVTPMAQVPDQAFALVLAGGLWLTLWQRPWRLAGLPLILAGLVLAPTGARPDMLIGRDGTLVAVRAPSGALIAHAERPSTFELKRWLEHDGDARDPAEARRGRQFTCDALGCVTTVGGRTVALSRHPGGLADDCGRADVLIVDGDRPADCPRPQIILDRAALRASGTVAVYFEGGARPRAESVADGRGVRPWSVTQDAPDRARPRERPTPPTPLHAPHDRRYADRIGRFAAPRAVVEAFAADEALRPEIEDEP